MRIFYKIELFKSIGRSKIKLTSLWHTYCLFVGLKILSSFLYSLGVAEFL